MEEQKCPDHLLLCSLDPNSVLPPTQRFSFVFADSSNPSTMFPKHSMITINQQAGGAAACPVSILLMTGEDCQTASSAPDGEIWVLPRLRRQRHCCELSAAELRSLAFDNKNEQALS